MVAIAPAHPSDDPAIETLLDRAFGRERGAKRSYAFRRNVERVWPLCLVARDGRFLAGSIRYWPIKIEPARIEPARIERARPEPATVEPASGPIGVEPLPALLLGPIAVDPAYRGTGLGGQLIRTSLALAAEREARLVLLVGDEPYYQRFHFIPASRHAITMDGEDPARVLVHWLQPRRQDCLGGFVRSLAIADATAGFEPNQPSLPPQLAPLIQPSPVGSRTECIAENEWSPDGRAVSATTLLRPAALAL